MTEPSAAQPASAQPAVTFHEIRRLVHHLPRLEPVVLPALPPMGKLTDWVQWLARSQGGKPDLRRMRLAIFVGAHGCAAEAIGARQRLTALTDGSDPVVKVLGEADADLRAYELDLETPTADFRSGPALSEDAAAHAMSYGMMAVEQGINLLALTGIGDGGELVYEVLLQELPGSQDPLATLAKFGGLEACAILGAILAARLAKVPVLLDGLAAEAAAQVLVKLDHHALEHCASAEALEPEMPKGNGLAPALGFLRLKGLAALAK